MTRVRGVAAVRNPRPDTTELTARLAAWRYVDAARLAARTVSPGRYSVAQARRDIEVLGAALADVLFLHEPHGSSPLCPGCSAPGRPQPWPCTTWRRLMTHFGSDR